MHGNQLAAQGLLGESKWRRPVSLVSSIFCYENVALNICIVMFHVETNEILEGLSVS